MADDAVGDEVARAGGDVVHRQLDAQRANRHHLQLGAPRNGGTVQVPPPGDRRVDPTQEAKERPRPTEQPHMAIGPTRGFDGEPEAQPAQRPGRPADDLLVAVRDQQLSAHDLAARVHDAGEETGTPGLVRVQRPAHDLADRPDRAARFPRRRDPTAQRRERGGSPIRRGQEMVRAAQCFQLKVLGREAPIRSCLVTTNEPVQVTRSVGVAMQGCLSSVERRGGPARPDEHAARMQPRALPGPAPARCDMPPAALGEEPVLTAGDQLGAAGEGDPMGRLRRGPVRTDLGADVLSTSADPLGSHDRITDLQLSDRARAPVGEQDRRLPRCTIGACMGAAPVWVDRPPERHRRGSWHPVQHRPGLHLVEDRAGELRGAHRTQQPPQPRQGHLRPDTVVQHLLSAPSHDHIRT